VFRCLVCPRPLSPRQHATIAGEYLENLAIAKESEVPDQSIFGGTATALKGFTGVLISLDNLWSKIDLFYS
jgi:hypothetical protein